MKKSLFYCIFVLLFIQAGCTSIIDVVSKESIEEMRILDGGQKLSEEYVPPEVQKEMFFEKVRKDAIRHCVYNIDCLARETCTNARCVKKMCGCVSDTNCSSNRRCVDCQCIP